MVRPPKGGEGEIGSSPTNIKDLTHQTSACFLLIDTNVNRNKLNRPWRNNGKFSVMKTMQNKMD